MNKIKLSRNQFESLDHLSTEVPVCEPIYIRESTFENINDAIKLCNALRFEIGDLENMLNDILYAIKDRGIDDAISKLRDSASIVKTIREDAKFTENYLAGGISKFLEASEIGDSFKVIAKNDEIKSYIERNFEILPVMSLGYSEGRFALIFGEDDDNIAVNPLIFAQGNQEDYERAQQFIETFLDLEKIDS